MPGIEPALITSDATAWTLALDYLGAGLPFHAHEVFEERWRQCAGEQRCAWRSLAQWAAALTHAARGNTTGARSMAQRAAESLLACETTPPEIDVPRVVASCRELADGRMDDTASERPLP